MARYLNPSKTLQGAQKLSDRFASLNWPRLLTRYAKKVNPLLSDLLQSMSYYWVTTQSEYSTDILFKNPDHLKQLFPRLLGHSTLCFGATDGNCFTVIDKPADLTKVSAPARKLIKKFKNLRGILDAPVEKVQATADVGLIAPLALRVIREVATLYLRECAEESICLIGEDKLARFWRMHIEALMKDEVFYAQGPPNEFSNAMEIRHLSVFFETGRVTHWEQSPEQT